MFKTLIMALFVVVNAQAASDKVEGHIFIRTLRVNESSLILFKNPTRDSARTIVTCTNTERDALNMLSTPETGGVILVPGSQVVFKNDTSKRFADGTQLKGKFIQFECVKEDSL